MSKPRWWVPLTLAAMSLVAGCGSPHGQASVVASQPPPLSLALSATSSSTAWATVEMGGSATQHNNFWQLFVHPATSAKWHLVTPPGMASNGGLVLAGLANQSLLTAFRPSQYITYSPLISTADEGAHWTTGQAAAGLADVPDALASQPAGAGLVALTRSGAVELSHDGGATWARLATLQSLAATAAGRACGLTGLTAAAYSPAGTALVAGSCAKHGIAGIFAYTGRGWQAAGPALPASVASQPVTVLRLTAAPAGETALLGAGGRAPGTMLMAWTSHRAGSWDLSPPLGTGGRHVLSASFGSAGSVGLVLSDRQGDFLPGPGGRWRQLPILPVNTQALAAGSSNRIEALAVHRSTMTVWAYGPAAGWAREQSINVPIQYGSSG
jgi:hypothetical protein